MHRNLFTLICMCIFSACILYHNKCDFETRVLFRNRSSDSATVQYTVAKSAPFKTIILPPGAQKDTTLCFQLKLKIDGHYTLKVSKNRKDTVLQWGYYTNGIAPKTPFLIELREDSIRIDELR